MAKNNIYKKLKKRGVSFEALARRTKMSRPLLSYYFENEHLLTGAVAEKISCALKQLIADVIEITAEFDGKFVVKR